MTLPPSLGVLIEQTGPIEGGQPFGSLSVSVRQLVERAAERGWTAFVCSPRDVLRQRRSVWGWGRNSGTWRRSFYPTPTIGYVRMDWFRPADREILLWLRDEAGTQFLTQPEVDEIVQDQWRLLQILLSHPNLTERVPEVSLLRDGVSIQKLLEDQRAVLVRSRFGRAGQGEAHLQFEGGRYLLRHEQRGVGHTREFRSAVKLRSTIEELFGDVLLQQYHEPLRIEDCPVGIRTVWQRGRDERWAELATVVRIGQPGSRTIRLATAGTLGRFRPILEERLGGRLKGIEFEVESTSKTVIELLSQRGHGASELAVDLGLTADGRVMVQSASTLAGLHALRRLPSPELRHAMMDRTLDYAEALLTKTYPKAATLLRQGSPVGAT